MINVITQVVCDWCEEVYEEDGPPSTTIIHAIRSRGWIQDSGNDFCCETCFDKHLARALVTKP
jgi:hypothetical protein